MDEQKLQTHHEFTTRGKDSTWSSKLRQADYEHVEHLQHTEYTHMFQLIPNDLKLFLIPSMNCPQSKAQIIDSEIGVEGEEWEGRTWERWNTYAQTLNSFNHQIFCPHQAFRE